MVGLNPFQKFEVTLLSLTLMLPLGELQAQMIAKATDLKAEPMSEAKSLKALQANTAVKMVKRQGFWAEIEAAGQKGWVKLSDLNMSTGANSGLTQMDTGRSGKNNIVSTSAARGLSAKELIAAKPDPQQFDQLKSLAVSAADAESFSKTGGLQTRTVSLLAAPSPSASSVPVTGQTGAARGKTSKNSDEDEDD